MSCVVEDRGTGKYALESERACFFGAESTGEKGKDSEVFVQTGLLA